jgi:hypothetical protein
MHMDSKKFIKSMGVSPKVIAPRIDCPINTSRGLRLQELQKDASFLQADIAAELYLTKRGLLIAD